LGKALGLAPLAGVGAQQDGAVGAQDLELEVDALGRDGLDVELDGTEAAYR
jgi:hypothetical protein